MNRMISVIYEVITPPSARIAGFHGWLVALSEADGMKSEQNNASSALFEADL